MAAGTPGGRRHLAEPKEMQVVLADGVGPEQLTEEQRGARSDRG